MLFRSMISTGDFVVVVAVFFVVVFLVVAVFLAVVFLVVAIVICFGFVFS